MGLPSARPTKHKYTWAIILSLVMKCQPGNSVETKLAFPQVVQNRKWSIVISHMPHHICEVVIFDVVDRKLLIELGFMDSSQHN